MRVIKHIWSHHIWLQCLQVNQLLQHFYVLILTLVIIFCWQMFYLLVLIIKSENNLIRKTNLFVCDRFHIHSGIDKLCITCGKLITTIELQYYVNLRATFNLNKSDNLSIWFDRQSIISIQLFANSMVWKGPSNHLQSSECFIYV